MRKPVVPYGKPPVQQDKLGRRMVTRERACKVCGAVYKPRNGAQRYCSYACSVEGSKRSAVCAECGESFTYSVAGNGPRKYCTPTCANRATAARRAVKLRKHRPLQVCPACGESFQARRWGQTYCSQRCRGMAARRKRRDDLKTWTARWSLKLKGEEACRACPNVAEELHHIVPRSRSPEARWDYENNGLPLCFECHRGWHDRIIFIYRDHLRPNEIAFAVGLVGEWWLEKNYPVRP